MSEDFISYAWDYIADMVLKDLTPAEQERRLSYLYELLKDHYEAPPPLGVAVSDGISAKDKAG